MLNFTDVADVTIMSRENLVHLLNALYALLQERNVNVTLQPNAWAGLSNQVQVPYISPPMIGYTGFNVGQVQKG
jgi:hypothetical protein